MKTTLSGCSGWRRGRCDGVSRQSAANQPGKLVEMSDHVADRSRRAQHAASIAKNELRCFLRVALFFLNHEEGGFMGVPEDREQGCAVHVIQRVVTPFASCDTRAVGSQDQAEFGP